MKIDFKILIISLEKFSIFFKENFWKKDRFFYKNVRYLNLNFICIFIFFLFSCSFFLCSLLSHMYFFSFNLLQNLVIKISWCNITWSWHERILLDLSLSENDLHLTIMSLDRLLIVAKSIIICHWYCSQLVKYFFLLFKFDIYFSLLNFLSWMINSSNSIFRIHVFFFKNYFYNCF